MSEAMIAKLQSAEQATATYSSANTPTDPVAPCPLLAHKEVVLVRVIGVDEAPLTGVAVALRNPKGEIMRSKTSADGVARFTCLTAGTFELGLYELDKDAWELVSVHPIVETAPGSPTWEPPVAISGAPKLTHTVAEGECVSKLAARYGFSAETVWNFPENAALKAQRKDMNILAPGDSLVIPARRVQWLMASPAHRYELRQKGGAQMLRIRFLKGNTARSGVDYLLKIETDDGAILSDQTGKTDADGFVIASVPPSVTSVEITLGQGGLRELHAFSIGTVRPIDTIEGVQARLTNLGYPCADDESGEIGPDTRAALRAFQRDHTLPISGDLDEETRAKLKTVFLS